MEGTLPHHSDPLTILLRNGRGTFRTHLPAHHHQHPPVPLLQRTIINTRPFRSSKNPPAPHHDLVSSAALQPGTLIAVRDTPTSPFHIAQVTKITEALFSIHYLGTTTPTMDSAVFRLLWIAPDSRTVMKDSCPARNHTAITGEIDTDDLDDLLVASHLTLTSTGRLTRKSARLLFHLRDQLHTY